MSAQKKTIHKNNSGVFFESRKFTKFEEPTRQVLFFVFSLLKKRKVQCNVFFLSTAAMRGINFRHKKKNKGATVLSFVADNKIPHPEVEKGHVYLGEIYLAPTYIYRAKKETPARYLIHGILHLCGYTHVRACDRMQMEALEEKIILALREKKILPDDF